MILVSDHTVLFRLHESCKTFEEGNFADNFRPAIWDNRSVFHTATFDYEGLGERFGNRVVGIGERPFLDPNSKSKAEALAAETNGAA
jgi:hypothetical protein